MGVDGRMGDRGWLGSSGEDSALRRTEGSCLDLREQDRGAEEDRKGPCQQENVII